MTTDDRLKDIREKFSYATKEWRSIREEARKDMQYISGNPWSAKDRRLREKAGRPCLSLDELNQYLNQLLNDVRRNKRAIKVAPRRAGANPQTAEFRANLIRDIEYNSNAQQAYVTMFENCAQRSYGFAKVKAQFEGGEGTRSWNQELILDPILNPDSITIDPDFKLPDARDMRFAFETEERTVSDFKAEFPDAEIRNFDSKALQKQAPDWIKHDKLQIALYWTVESKKKKLYQIGSKAPGSPPPVSLFEDEFKDGVKPPKDLILNVREESVPSITSYLTNGVEILKETPWKGKWIPIICCFGRILYIDDGSGAEKKILSMIRLARDPYMLYCYYRTCQAELVGMTPKTPFIGYTGQFRGKEEDWKRSPHEPVAYLEANPTTEVTGANVLPLPQRQPFDPPIQNLEIGAEAAKRAIQSALGRYNTSVGRADTKATSGVAVKELDAQSDQGSFHFIDHYDEALKHAGRMLDDLIPHYYDTAREVGLRNATGDYKSATINDPSANPPIDASVGEHDVTIATGPSTDSERDAAEQFADSLAQGSPQIFAQIADLVIKLKNLGPIGDQIAARLTPPQYRNLQDPAQAAQHIQQLEQTVKQLQGELQKAADMIKTEQVKSQARLQEAAGDAVKEIHMLVMKNAKDITVARIQASKDTDISRAELMEEGLALQKQLLHEAAQNELDRQHEAGLAASGQAHDAGMAAVGAVTDQSAQAADQAHDVNMSAVDAANAPPPAPPAGA